MKFGRSAGGRRRWSEGLLVLLLAGLALRVVLAYVLLPGSGFRTDIGTFAAWALTLAEHGPGRFYDVAGFADYPPGYLYVLWLVGGLANAIADVVGASAGAVAGGLIKLPPMLADVGIAALLYALVRRWAAPRADGERLALFAAGIYLFNPVTWYDSAIWGQTDAVGALVMLLGIAALIRGNSEGAAGLAVLAALVKPQFGVVFAPLVGVVLLRRHLLVPGSGPRHTPLVPRRLRAWFEEERGAWRLLSSAVVGLLVLYALITPFALDLPGFIRRMAETAGGYEFLSVNAYNLWALIGADGRPPFAFGGGWSPDTVPLVGPLPAVIIGGVLLAGGFLLGLGRVAWRDDRFSIIVVAALLSLAFFVLPTRVHERYLFPIFAVLPLLAAFDRRWLWATAVLALASFINLHGVLTTPLYATPNIVGLPLGELFREPLAIVLSAVLHTAVFGFICWQLRPSAPDSIAAATGAPEHLSATETPPPAPVGPAPEVRSGGAPWFVGWRRFERWMEVVPLRRDRSALLAGEGGGRIKRLDVLLLLVVFLVTLSLRTFRLDEPREMYFDEVYHARTGIEFLQHWQYGMPHPIYEYTHPHLAKYAMGLGIITLGNNRVTGTAEMGGPVIDAAVERRWSPRDAPTERNGDRLYLATGTELLAYDLTNLAEPPSRIAVPAVALAVDESDHVLYVGDSAGGLWRIPTIDLDIERHTGRLDGLANPQLIVAIVELDGRLQGLVHAHSRLVALAADGALVFIDPVEGEVLGQATVPGAAAVVGARSDGVEVLVVGGAAGFVVLELESLEEVTTIAAGGSVTGMALVTDGVDRPTVYGAVGDTLQTLQLATDDAPVLGPPVDMPNDVDDAVWNRATTMIHVLGRSQDGAATTVYLVEPRSNAVFADARLPFAPQALALDSQPQRPALDRADLLAFDAAGNMARVDVGSNAFAWRLPGVIVAALMAALIYLLARFLFERRSIAAIAALLVAVDGMFFSNARIAMNDTYVAFFIVAALTVFAPLWLRRWRSSRAVVLGFVAVGVLLGLALAAKWVAMYAIGAVGLLILLRSALGRLVALAVMIGLTAFLGYIAITPAASVEAPQANYLFLLLMVGLTLALAAGMALRPVRMTPDEMRLAVYGPAVPGVALLAVGALLLAAPDFAPAALPPTTLVYIGTGLTVLAVLLQGAFWLAGRLSLGPRAGPGPVGTRRSAPPPPRGWLRPGSGRLGVSWLLALAAVTVLPLSIYTASYLPWIELGSRWTTDLPAGHTGQTFLDLQRSMYDYHNYLRATHPASSPWWAWPLNLKPVWFEQEGYANDTTAVIYNTGNLVIFWLAIPAVAWVAYQAWRRRSLALTFLVIAIASLWLPWARIDRVAFQYHIFTTLPFAFLALAYFLGELWHGPSSRTWLLARVAAAVAIVAPALLWIMRLPLCTVAGVESVSPGAEICGLLNRQLVVTDVQLVGVALAALALMLIVLVVWLNEWLPPALRERRDVVLPLAVVGLIAGFGLMLAGAIVPAQTIFEAPLRLPEVPALLALTLLALPAYYVLRARDARRFVVGALVAAATWFVLWYPNFGGLPVPSRLAQVHLGLLPTWNYSFQFGSNQDEASRAPPDLASVLLLAAVLSLLVLGVVSAVRARRNGQTETGFSPAVELD
jgi:predicted membrane-bound dolichyl-phosphate-mannose-protein mannosyltransferase